MIKPVSCYTNKGRLRPYYVKKRNIVLLKETFTLPLSQGPGKKEEVLEKIKMETQEPVVGVSVFWT